MVRKLGQHRPMSKIIVAGLGWVALTGATLPPETALKKLDFCARLAVNIGVDKPAAPDGRTEWTINAMNFGQRFFLGGTAATGVSVTPIEPATVDDYRRAEDMCGPDGKGAICKLVGPMNFRFLWKGNRVITPIAAGEKATIWVKGLKTTCRTEA
ncbi:hypothetical protein [Sphingomonas parapaucimobilis]|uniref:hypothetical protein n=2 Tax=Sphingomonas parapaucimobilis TaxID=28213 RepID=UPI001FE0CB15|nr:hypothetical protein [Sphingomonas parapaucimobilis]